MHDQVLRKIMATKGLPYTARCIWALMATHKRGYVIQRNYLKQVLGVSEASIKSALKELRTLGAVEEVKRKPDGTFEDGSRLTADGKTAFGAAVRKTTQIIQDKSQQSKSNIPRSRSAASSALGEVVDLNDNFAPLSTSRICLEDDTAPFDDPLYIQSQEHDAKQQEQWEQDISEVLECSVFTDSEEPSAVLQS